MIVWIVMYETVDMHKDKYLEKFQIKHFLNREEGTKFYEGLDRDRFKFWFMKCIEIELELDEK